jgi:uncharacterized iron-regulated membrane protein
MSPVVIRLRSAWFQIHKWFGIVLAILIIPISLTGSALVWHDWLDEQVNPQRYPAAGVAALPASDYAASAATLIQPGERIASIVFPDDKGSVQATLTKPAEGGGRPQRAWVFLNPKTAEPIERANSSEGLVRVLHGLHGSLLAPGVGRQIIGWIGVAMLISALTGIWLWWPLKGRFSQGLRWKRRPDLNSNLHHMGGFWIALPLAALSLTGVWISFPAVFSQFNGPQPAGPGGPGGAGGPAMPLAQTGLRPDAALAAAKKAAPGKAVSLAWPTDKKADWTVMVKGQGAPTEVKVKDSDASASITPPKPETLARTMRRIHDGTGMPLVWQIIIFVGGILPAALSVTGILMWLRMRRRRQRHRRSAGLVEAEA